MFCKHEWKLIDKTILESGLEQLLKNNSVDLKDPDVLNELTWSSEFYKKKVVIVFQCTKCPKIKKIVEANHGY